MRSVKKIITPLFRKILSDCPEAFRPLWHAQESCFKFPNGSEIAVAGIDAGNAESLRGAESHLSIIDEAGFASDLRYVVADVLLPMSLTNNGRVVIASTPAKTPRHPFEDYAKEAEFLGSYIKLTIHDNPMISDKRIQEFIRESGGEDSTTWKREYLAQFIIDADSIVIPEFTDAVALELVIEVDRPSHFDCYVSLDPGYRDLTAALFGWWDFVGARLVIEDEFIAGKDGVKVRTDIIADGIKAKEKELWGTKKPYFRVSDIELILIQDLADLHGLQFHPTSKDTKIAQINELRVMIQQRKIVIHPRCVTLISHMKNAVWDTSKEFSTFARIAGFGHFDGIDALSYMLRNVRKSHNPFPQGVAYDSNKFYKPDFDFKDNSPTAKTLKRIFPRPKF